jgi:hypothetical protein
MSIAVLQQTGSFDLFRLSKSKAAVDLAPNTLRAYFKDGLNFYKRGKAIFVSRTEVEAYIRKGPQPASAPETQAQRRPGKRALAA